MSITNLQNFIAGRSGGRIITSADGAVSGDFAGFYVLQDAKLASITFAGSWSGANAANSQTRLVAVDPLVAGLNPLVEFSAIELTSGTVQLINR